VGDIPTTAAAHRPVNRASAIAYRVRVGLLRLPMATSADCRLSGLAVQWGAPIHTVEIAFQMIQSSSLSYLSTSNLLAYACHSLYEQAAAGFAEPGDRRVMAFVHPELHEDLDSFAIEAGWPSAVAKEGSD
jgi:hypothetical protein